MASGGLRDTRTVGAGFLNATSLKKHMWAFRHYLSTIQTYQLFGIAETRLGPSVDDSFGEIEGYSIIRQDRNTIGGGVLLYIQNSLKAKVLFKSATTQAGKPREPKYIFCIVWEGDSPPIFFAVIYIPPDVNFRSDSQFINRLRSFCSEYRHKIIMGDWNWT